MKITGKTLQVSFEHNVSVGNGSIEATLQHFAFINETKNGDINVDLDFVDIANVKFMGLPIEEGYKGYQKFKKTMSDLGIDITKMFDDEAAKLITDEEMEKLTSLYYITVKK